MPTFCHACGSATAESAKFCSECGTRLSTSAIEDASAGIPLASAGEDEDVPSEGFTIQFNSSGSTNYPFALAAAKHASTYQEFSLGKVTVHRATFQLDETDRMLDLLEALKGFRNRKVWVDGQPLMWDEAFGWLWCYNQRRSAYMPDQYCFGEEEYSVNLWGCIHSGMPFASTAQWLTHGFFDRDGAFHLDKDRIRHEANTALHRFRFCPAFDGSFVERVIDALPEKVNPNKDKDWEYQQAYGLTGSGNQVITIKIKEDGFVYEQQVNGVAPRNLDAAKAIMMKLRRRLPQFP